jgi:hypothetical protein
MAKYGMAKTIQITEPLEFTAGDTVTWHKSLSDYPANDGWSLVYTLINATAKLSIASTASGSDHAINITALISSGYAAGIYSWQSCVTKGLERYTVGAGNIRIQQNLAGEVAGVDLRSSAKKCLDQLDAALANYGKKAYLQAYEIAGRSMKFNAPSDFLTFRSKIQQEVNREIAVTRIKNGLSARNKSTIGF